VSVVQPRFSRVCWCSGRIRGSGAGMSGGRVSCGVPGYGCTGDLVWIDLFFERNRDMMFEMEKWCSDDFEGSVAAMANGVVSAKNVINPRKLTTMSKDLQKGSKMGRIVFHGKK